MANSQHERMDGVRSLAPSPRAAGAVFHERDVVLSSSNISTKTYRKKGLANDQFLLLFGWELPQGIEFVLFSDGIWRHFGDVGRCFEAAA